MQEANSREEDNVGSFIVALLCFGMVAFLVYFIYSSVVQPIKDDIGAHQARKQNIAHYDEDTNTLVVYQRQPGMADQIEISPEYGLPNIKHVNDSQVYTGTVIGGVAVGNVTTFKGGDYLTPGAKTGYYKVNYKYAKHLDTGGYLGGSIYYIELSIGNYMAAKQNPVIRKFVEPRETTKGQLVCSSDKLTPAGRAFKAIPDDFSSEGRLRLLGHSLTRRECEYLRDWLASANADQNLAHEKELRDNQSINGYYDIDLFDIVGTELRKYHYETSQDKVVTVPDGITTIGRNAFSGAAKLKEVILPISIKHISNEAFSSCTSLCKINVPQDATIEPYAFSKCRKLANADGFVIINNHLQSYLGAETDVVVPEDVHTIFANAFAQNKKITTIKLPDSVRSVDVSFVWGCTSLEEIVVPQHVTLTASMFRDCPKLIDEKGLLVINNTLLLYNGRDSSVIIPDGVETVCASAFANNQIIKSVKCPVSVKVIETGSFSNCAKLHTVELSPNLKVIEKETFYKCKALKTVMIPQGVEQISTGAFWQCPALTSIIIPESTKKICKNAFRKCAGLKEIILSDCQASIPSDVYATCDLAQIVYLDGNPTEESVLAADECTGIFSKKTFIVSGVSKSEEHRIKKEILNQGGILDKSVTRKLDYLICSEVRYGITARIDTAMDNKIKGCQTCILTVEEFDQLVATSSANLDAPTT